ncbi:MAG TPA: alpha/beta fold hydrolase [Methanocella sp.]|uniref:alpha/beta fold hydrolase n=1 Tax=Methanocella sp. TaxID=2052833 RepID=UPI002B9CD4AD|nr:alpha/beta fold hydrolase [Methanocella sp.]HTY89640.1 alpha/beta fold hydrolase [Methanocella sp.]
MPMSKVRDVDIYYEASGGGEPLVLISGYTADHTSWAHLVPVFAKKYCTVVFDNRGVGQTVTPDGPFIIDDMADDTAALLDALDIKKAHVIGVSMGGRIAQALALRHPEKVKGLVLCSTTARVPPRSRFALGMMADALAKGNISHDFHDMMMLSWTLSDHVFGSPEMMKRMRVGASSERKRPLPANMVRQLQAGYQFDTRARLGEIKAPTLVIHGNEDILFPISYGKELADGIPGAKFVELKGAAHTAYMEAADRFVPAVLAFLAGVDATSAQPPGL